MSKKIVPWKTLSSDVILNHPRLKITEDTAELPNGRTTRYVRHAAAETHSVAAIAVNSDGMVLIQQEYSYPPDKVMWQLPGGSMEPGESPEAAALRELAEESGYSAKKTKVIGSFYVHNRLSDQRQFIVLCTELFEHKLPENADEFISTHWMSRSKVIDKIRNNGFDNINLLAGLNFWLNMKGNK